MQVSRKALLGALQRAVKVVRRPGIPALTGVLLEVNELGIRLTTTDLETTYRAAVVGTGDGTWTALPPAKALKDAIGKISDETLTLEHDAVEARFIIVRENGARISFRTLPVDDFPTVPVQTGATVVMTADGFRAAFGTVLPFVSPDTARPTLQGVCLEVTETELTAVATDSYRLGVTRTPATAVLEFAGVIVPGHALKNALAELGKDSGHVRITSGQGSTTIVLPSGAQWTVRNIKGQFPNWRQLIPETFDGTLTFDLAEALEAVTTAGLIVNDTVPMRLELNGSVRITASSRDEGSFEQTLERTTYEGEEMSIGYDPAYFLSCLKATDGAPMRLRDALKPAVFGNLETDGRTVLLMPVRMH